MRKACKRFVCSSVFLSAVVPEEACACALDDIRIEQAEVIIQNRMTYVSGRIVNACGDETGAQIRITLQDDAETTVYACDFWPASAHNIPARDTHGFTYVVSPVEPNPERRASRIAIEVVGLSKW